MGNSSDKLTITQLGKNKPAEKARRASCAISAVEKEYLSIFNNQCPGGYMTQSELLECLSNLGLPPRRADVNRLFTEISQKSVGVNKNMRIPGSGFVEFMHTYRDTCILERAFALFDLDGNGRISVQELKTCACKLGDQLTATEALALVRMVDVDNDQMINFKEYVRMMTDREDDFEMVLDAIESNFGKNFELLQAQALH